MRIKGLELAIEYKYILLFLFTYFFYISFMKLVETQLVLIMFSNKKYIYVEQKFAWIQSKLYFRRNLPFRDSQNGFLFDYQCQYFSIKPKCASTIQQSSLKAHIRDSKHVGCLTIQFKSNLLATCSANNPSNRVNCGYPGISRLTCESRGCCFDDKIPAGVDWCFYPGKVHCSFTKAGAIGRGGQHATNLWRSQSLP